MKKEEKKNGKVDAFALFPDLLKESESVVQSRGERKATGTPVGGNGDSRQRVSHKSEVLAPLAPDLSWLRGGNYENLEQNELKDIPTALVLMKPGDAKDSVSSILKDLGYQVETADTAFEAIHNLTSTDYAAVVVHAGFEGGTVSLVDSAVHKYMAWLPMARRRLIYYILVGAELHTLYNLQALSLSANLVVNDADLEQLATILRKGFRDYEELFGPLLESLGGKMS